MVSGIYDFPMSFETVRMISLAYVNEKNKFVKIPVFVTNDIHSESRIEKEFEKKGMLYDSIISYAKINPENITNMRLFSESIRSINIRKIKK